MTCSFKAYIDEAGDEGFKFGAGSTDWFVLSAVIVPAADDLQSVKVIDRVRARLGKGSRAQLHFRELSHERRVFLLSEIVKERFTASSVLVHKPSLTDVDTFRERYRLYFYTARYLLERISWYCRDSPGGGGDGTVDVVFSTRSNLSYAELKAYFDLLRTKGGWDQEVSIDWNTLDPDRIRALSPRASMGLQVADAVATGIFKGVQVSHLGQVEDRYARMLKPITYRRSGGRYGSYGMKLWPHPSAQLLSDPRLQWLRSEYEL